MRTDKIDKDPAFSRQVGLKEKQKLLAKSGKRKTVWSGFGLFGMIGWSVAIPTLGGTALGLWLDAKHPGSISWTLSLLIAGLSIGCLIAWHWVAKENKEMHKNEEENE